MKHLSPTVVALAVLGVSSQALAQNRCQVDFLLTNDQAWGRLQWARRCAQENPYGYSTGRDPRFWYAGFNAEANEAESWGVYVYPVYWDSTTNQPWLGPGAAGSPTAGYTGAQIANLSCTSKPPLVYNDGLCVP